MVINLGGGFVGFLVLDQIGHLGVQGNTAGGIALVGEHLGDGLAGVELIVDGGNGIAQIGDALGIIGGEGLIVQAGDVLVAQLRQRQHDGIVSGRAGGTRRLELGRVVGDS